MSYYISALLIIVGIIHLLALSGALGPAKLAALYNLDFDEANIAILMRHRACLFGLLGAFIVYAAFVPTIQLLAFIGGFVSLVSFIILALQIGEYNHAIRKVLIVDFFALACLIVAALLKIAS